MKDISWLTDEDSAILVTKVTENVKKFMPELRDALYFAEKLNTDVNVKISYRDGRMLFDGEDIETEDFMVIVGILDAVDESPQGSLVFKGEGSVWE